MKYPHQQQESLGCLAIKCDKCPRVFKDHAGLISHEFDFHVADRLFACTLCDYKFRLLNDLNHHLKVNHQAPISYNVLTKRYEKQLNVQVRRKREYQILRADTLKEAGHRRRDEFDECRSYDELLFREHRLSEKAVAKNKWMKPPQFQATQKKQCPSCGHSKENVKLQQGKFQVLCMNKLCVDTARKCLPDWVVARFDNFKVGIPYFKQNTRSPKADQDLQVSSALMKLEEAERQRPKGQSPAKVPAKVENFEPVQILMRYGKKGGKPFISIDPSADLHEVRETFKKFFQQDSPSPKKQAGPPPEEAQGLISPPLASALNESAPSKKKSLNDSFCQSICIEKLLASAIKDLNDPLQRPPHLSSSAQSPQKGKLDLPMDPETGNQADEAKGGSQAQQNFEADSILSPA